MGQRPSGGESSSAGKKVKKSPKTKMPVGRIPYSPPDRHQPADPESGVAHSCPQPLRVLTISPPDWRCAPRSAWTAAEVVTPPLPPCAAPAAEPVGAGTVVRKRSSIG